MTANIVLPVKQKYLIGVGASIAAGCQPCTLSFADGARKAGACERGVRFAIESGLAARLAATSAMAAFATEQLPHPAVDDAFRAERTTLDALIAVAGAVAGSTASRVQAAVDNARRLGAGNELIEAVAEVARTARSRAASETDAALDEALGKTAARTESGCAGRPSGDGGAGCGCRQNPALGT